jgi:hypothetical protein
MKRQRSEPPSTGTSADDQSRDRAMPDLARRFRELFDRGGETSGGASGLLVPGTEEDKLVRELIEANRKAEDPESRRRRQERDAYLTARLARILGKNSAERAAILDKLDRRGELLRDACLYKEIIYLSEPHSPAGRLKVTQRIWDEFIPKHKDKDAFDMGLRDLHAALWPESDPSRSTTRRGYRPEIKAYMKAHSLRTNLMAARHFGVGVDTLKSIMSSNGKVRCSQDTLDEVLKKIGFLP